MENIVGIFHSLEGAEQAMRELVEREIPRDSIVLLSREQRQGAAIESSPEQKLDGVRTDPAKTGPNSAGKASGAALGFTVGGAGGFAAGATAAALTVPGLGVIFAIGLGAGLLLGLGGAAAGAKVGSGIEGNLDMGSPKEQVDFYRQLLRRGDSLVIVNVVGGSQIATVREVFQKRGSEDMEHARRELGKAA